MLRSVSPEVAAVVLAQKSRGGTRIDPALEPRTIESWWRMDHFICEDGCSNPDCVDRHPSGRGANPVVKIRTELVCRSCFLSGFAVIK